MSYYRSKDKGLCGRTFVRVPIGSNQEQPVIFNKE